MTNTIDAIILRAELGDKIAQLSLGKCFHFGKGVEKNERTAIDWYLKAWEQGHSLAACNIGRIYYEKYGLIPQNLSLSEEWLLKSAELGDVTGQFELGSLYMDELDEFEAAEFWLRQASEQHCASSTCRLGELSFYGLGKVREPEKAVKVWFQLAEKKLPRAIYYLAGALLTGDGIKQDRKKAIEYLKQVQCSIPSVKKALSTGKFSFERLKHPRHHTVVNSDTEEYYFI